MASIHFYDMPKYSADAFSFGDNLLTQKVESLKSVIVLGRTTRLDKCKVSSFKTPLLKVTVVHEDAAVTNYLKEFSDYISSELNVLDVDFHAGEQGYATLELDPDFMKIREIYAKEEVPKMVKLVKNFCSKKDLAEIQELRKSGKIVFENVEITQEICHVKLVPTNESAGADSNGFLLLFDMTQNDQLKLKAVERALFSKIQQARKAGKLELSDRRNVVVEVHGGLAVVTEVIKMVADKINGEVKAVEKGEKPEEFDGVEIDDVVFTVQLE